MEKKEYNELYSRWTKADRIKESTEIADVILEKAFEELKSIEEAYAECGMAMHSPCHLRKNVICIDKVEKTRLARVNSAEVILSLCSEFDDRWQDVVLNTKYFGENGKKLLKWSLLKAALSECESEISKANYQIKTAEESLSANLERKKQLEEKMKEISLQEEQK